jgi:GNAT superfamily N-acetyltransferase
MFPIAAAGIKNVGGKVVDGAVDAAQEGLEGLSRRWEGVGVDNFITESNGKIKLHHVAVPKGKQNQGQGTSFMEDLTKYADGQGKRLELTPGQKDDRFGTTSNGRLKKFYKRFGFVENKGRNKDFTTIERMYREPTTPQGIVDDSPLPADTASRMKRAEEQGFDTDVFHGTASAFEGFDKKRLGAITKARGAKNAVWLSDNPQTANTYAAHAEGEGVQKLIDQSEAAERAGKWDDAHSLMVDAEKLEAAGGPGGANVIPAKIRGNLMEYDADGATLRDLDDGQIGDLIQEAMDGGFDGLKISNFSDEADWGQYNPTTHYAIFDPKNIRSKHAMFDPAKKDSADLLASVGGASLLGVGGSRMFGDDD